MKSEILIFAVYSILYEMIIWGIFGYAVFGMGYSGWWMVLAIIISSHQLEPKNFGIKKEDENND